METKHTVGLIVEDRPGILAKISGMVTRRGYNIDTITVGKSADTGTSKMVLTLTGDEKIIEQVTKQMNKLIDVIKVSEFRDDSIFSELALIKVFAKDNDKKNELIKISEIYKTKIADLSPRSIIFQIVGTSEKIDSFLDVVKNYGIQEISRTGVTAISRGSKSLARSF